VIRRPDEISASATQDIAAAQPARRAPERQGQRGPHTHVALLKVSRFALVVALRPEDDKESPPDYAEGRSLNVTSGGTQ
jgi:hypothetical protein